MSESLQGRLFFSKAIEIAPRVLGHQDRNGLSPTFGIFGRKYWAWKTAAFADASNQYALYYLALLWSLNDAKNPFYHNEDMLEWIVSGINAWCRLQKKDGSFDQVFVNEHSFGATAYTLLAVIQTEAILGGCLPTELRERLAKAVESAGCFLLNNGETYGVIANHMALFAVTFQELWTRTRNNDYQDKCRRQIQLILNAMSPEGWFREYEGADPGYMTQCLYYLARLYRSGWQELKEPLEKAIKEFVPYFIHPDGSIGGCYGCRDTVLFYPAGFSLLCNDYPQAKKILSYMNTGILQGMSPSPAALDFPNAIRLAANYLVAWNYLKDINGTLNSDQNYCLPCENDNIYKRFPEAGMVVVSTPVYYSVLGVKKGGVLKVFDKISRRLVYEDRGYCAYIGNKRVVTQMFNDPQTEYHDNSVMVQQSFFILKLRMMNTLKYFLILLLGATAFRIKWFREWFKRLMVKHLMTEKQPTSGKCKRVVTFGVSEVHIKDRLYSSGKKELYAVKRMGNYSTIHMASAQYFDFSSPARKKTDAIPNIGANEVVDLEYRVSFPFQDSARKKVSSNAKEGS